jgi:hypothetical protein
MSGRRCQRCGSIEPQFVAQHEIEDLAADMLQSAGPQAAHDLILGARPGDCGQDRSDPGLAATPLQSRATGVVGGGTAGVG